MKKNIIVCCDGTGNQLGESYSNVVKLYMVLEKSAQQSVYYDPGVGTLADPNLITPWTKELSTLFGLAFGSGMMRNVSEAYSYLMENYIPGDEVYLFGFSRGAYTARVLAAMLHHIGLLPKGNQQLIPYALKAYTISYTPANKAISANFKATYSQDIKIKFIGVWDTVTSIGLFNRISYPNTTTNPSIEIIRHAVSIDERRSYYRQNLFIPASAQQDIRQVWFAGVHSDVGGSYSERESGLSQITLAWMIKEATPFGLLVDTQKVANVVNGANGGCKPNEAQRLHRSLSGFWWVLEFIPRKNRRTKKWFIPGGKYRMIAPKTDPSAKSLIHESVFAKKNVDATYRPPLPPGSSYIIVK